LHSLKINQTWRQALLAIFSAISGAFRSRDVSAIIRKLINAERKPFHHPETLRSPYSSRHDMILDCGTCALLLSGKSPLAIISDIEASIFGAVAKWENRTIASQFACEIAVALPYNIGLFSPDDFALTPLADQFSNCCTST
jgi:hypothetical protein